MVDLSELRASLPKYRRRVQRGETIQVDYYGNPVAYLKPYDSGVTGVEMPLTEFRRRISHCWESLDAGTVRAYILTSHGQPKALFVPYEA